MGGARLSSQKANCDEAMKRHLPSLPLADRGKLPPGSGRIKRRLPPLPSPSHHHQSAQQHESPGLKNFSELPPELLAQLLPTPTASVVHGSTSTALEWCTLMLTTATQNDIEFSQIYKDLDLALYSACFFSFFLWYNYYTDNQTLESDQKIQVTNLERSDDEPEMSVAEEASLGNDPVSSCQTVEIVCEPGQSVGFCIQSGGDMAKQDGTFVADIVQGSTVETNGLLHIGDEITKVNSLDITQMPIEIVALIMQHVPKLTLTILSSLSPLSLPHQYQCNTGTSQTNSTASRSSIEPVTVQSVCNIERTITTTDMYRDETITSTQENDPTPDNIETTVELTTTST